MTSLLAALQHWQHDSPSKEHNRVNGSTVLFELNEMYLLGDDPLAATWEDDSVLHRILHIKQQALLTA